MNITEKDIQNIKEYFQTLNNEPVGTNTITLSQQVLDWFPPPYNTRPPKIQVLEDLPLTWFWKMKTLLSYGELFTSLESYTKKVRELTKKNHGSDKKMYHIIPISKGFKYKIPPEKMVHPANLTTINNNTDDIGIDDPISQESKTKLDNLLNSLNKPPSSEKIKSKKMPTVTNSGQQKKRG